MPVVTGQEAKEKSTSDQKTPKQNNAQAEKWVRKIQKEWKETQESSQKFRKADAKARRWALSDVMRRIMRWTKTTNHSRPREDPGPLL